MPAQGAARLSVAESAHDARSVDTKKLPTHPRPFRSGIIMPDSEPEGMPLLNRNKPIIAAVVLFGRHPTSTTAAATTTTTTTLPATTTTTASPPTTAAPPPTPLVLVCSGQPAYKPTILRWCTPLCSNYVINISWTSWTANFATGNGTLITNDCAKGTLTAQRYTVSLSNPQNVSYCTGSAGTPASGRLFTATDIWDSPLPNVTPPCP
jgi:hypothetical protein